MSVFMPRNLEPWWAWLYFFGWKWIVAALVVGTFVAIMVLAFAPSKEPSSRSNLGSTNSVPVPSSGPSHLPGGLHGLDGSLVRAGEALDKGVDPVLRVGETAAPRPARTITVPRGEPRTVISTLPHEPYGATIERTIREAAAYREANADQLYEVAVCESNLRPDAVGDHGASVGIFQFQELWLPLGHRLGYPGDWRTDPYASADVAAYLFAQGRADRWTCARNLGYA